MRTYTPRAVRPAEREIDVDVVRHGTIGPAGRWIEKVQPGDRLLVVAPVADVPGIDEIGLAWKPGPATTVLVAGDETAAPAVTNIVEALPRGTRGVVLIETPTAADRWPVAAPAGVEVTFLERGDEEHGAPLERAVREQCWDIGDALSAPAPGDAPDEERPDAPPIWEEPTAAGTSDHFAWLAGESGTITRLRRHLVTERGWPRDRVAFMGYWKRGRPEG